MKYKYLFFLFSCFFTLSLHSGTKGSETEDERETARAKRSGSLIFVPRSIRMKETHDRLKTEAKEAYDLLFQELFEVPITQYISSVVGIYNRRTERSMPDIQAFLDRYKLYISVKQKKDLLGWR